MISVLFPDAACFTYDLCGKFQSPSPEWMHLTRNLVNFELMVVTEGTLFIADERRSYEVHPGEYLLLPPTVHQHGSKKGSCAFYWLHFIPGIPSAPIIAPSDPTAGSVLDEFHAAPPSSYRLEDLAPAQLPSNYPETLCIPRQGTLSSPNRVIILMKQLQDTSLRFHNTFLNNSLTAAVLGEINCQSPFYRTYTSETQRTQILQDIISYIQYHSSESLKVTELARYFGYNDKYLSSLFHEGTGMTLKQFILKSKMDSAMAELTDTNHTVSQICLLYTSPSPRD